MRKKYLSALLFGALLFASAGTFTSCKDYDDDINNLQEQINTINTTLSELKTLVGDGGVSSVTFDESTGVLTVVDANGTKTYTIKTTAGSVDEVKITIEGQELKVNGETVGKVGDTVAVANGELTINGTATGIKVGEYAILDNQTTGTVTITLPDADGKMQTVELMKASAALTAVEFENTLFRGTTGNEIQWNKALIAHPDWAGPKGAVERNQLLVGQINWVNVQVTPASYDLGAQELTLVDSKGNVAPVKVTAKTNERLLSRAASANGSWSLYIEMTDAVNADNIDEIFDYESWVSGGVVYDNQLGYTLCVNGIPFSAYDLGVKTANDDATTTLGTAVGAQTGNLQFLNLETGRDELAINTPLPVGKTTELFINNAFLYDSYITFEGTNKSLAEQYGIVANGMNITVPAEATGVTIVATIHTMSVDGTEQHTYTNQIRTEAGTIASQTIETTTHEIKPDADPANILRTIRISLGDVFTKIPAATREEVKNPNQIAVVEEVSQTGFIADDFRTVGAGKYKQLNVTYRKADGTVWAAGTDDLVDLKYVDIPVLNNVASDAKPGSYKLSIVCTDTNNVIGTGNVSLNEIIKIDMPVNVTVPAFDAMFEKTAKWSDGAFNARISIDNSNKAVLRLGDAFSKTSAYNAEYSHLGFAINNINGVSPIVGGTPSSTNTNYTVIGAQSTAELKTSLIYNSTNTALAHSKLENMVAYYTLFDVVTLGDAGLTSNDDLDAVKEAFTVTSTPYTSNIITALDGVQLVNYINSAAQEGITLDAAGHINGYTENAQGVGNGLALVLANKLAVNSTNIGATTAIVAGTTGTLNNAEGAKYYIVDDTNAGNNVKIEWSTAQSGTTLVEDGTGMNVTGLTNPSTLKVKLTDATGFIYTDDIKIEPAR